MMVLELVYEVRLGMNGINLHCGMAFVAGEGYCVLALPLGYHTLLFIA